MKYFNSTKAVISASISTALTLLCFALYLLNRTQSQYFTVGIILISFSASSWLSAVISEKDKSSKALSIANIVLDVGCFLCVALYGFLRKDVFLFASTGFAGILIAVFVIVLICKIKRK